MYKKLTNMDPPEFTQQPKVIPGKKINRFISNLNSSMQEADGSPVSRQNSAPAGSSHFATPKSTGIFKNKRSRVDNNPTCKISPPQPKGRGGARGRGGHRGGGTGGQSRGGPSASGSSRGHQQQYNQGRGGGQQHYNRNRGGGNVISLAQKVEQLQKQVHQNAHNIKSQDIRLNNVEKSVFHNDLRVFNVGKTELDFIEVISNILIEGCQIEQATAEGIIHRHRSIERVGDNCLLLRLGSAMDREIVWRHKKNLKDYDNPFHVSEKISVQQNYTKKQKRVYDERHAVCKKLEETYPSSTFKPIGLDKISQDDTTAIHFKKFM